MDLNLERKPGGSLWACLDPLPRAAIEKETAGHYLIDNGSLIVHSSAEQGQCWPVHRRLRP
jgi:hypothetical protein